MSYSTIDFLLKATIAYEVYMIACKAEGEQFGARRFAKGLLLTTAHEYTSSSPLTASKPCLKDSGMQEAFLQSQMIQSISKTFRFSWNCSKKKRATIAWAQGVVLGSFHCPSVVFFAVRASGPEPSSESFPFVDLPTMGWLQGSCYMLVCSTQLWMPVTRQWGSRFFWPSLISASFSETASLKRYLVSFGLWLWTSKGSKSHLPWALGYQRDTCRSEVRWSCQPVQQRKPEMHRNSIKMWGTKNFGRAIYFCSGGLKLQTSRVTRYLKSHACPWSRPYQARRSGDFDNGNASEHPNRWIFYGLIFRPNWLSWRIDCPNPHHGSQTLVTWTIWTEPEWIQLDIFWYINI